MSRVRENRAHGSTGGGWKRNANASPRQSPTQPTSALTVMSHNLGRAVGQLAGPELNTATAATLQRKVFTMPGRLVHSGRQRRLRLPENWPWAVAITAALDKITAIPLRC